MIAGVGAGEVPGVGAGVGAGVGCGVPVVLIPRLRLLSASAPSALALPASSLKAPLATAINAAVVLLVVGVNVAV